jgi:hypothetical protein
LVDRSCRQVGCYRGTSRVTGVEIDARFAHLWSAADGVLTRFETFPDPAVLRDAGRREAGAHGLHVAADRCDADAARAARTTRREGRYALSSQ